ncbi:MAG: hypothetical protein LUH42_01445 [Oscillospiraceae bacterium]|nr:hypothetical protein [Oscillospiraceae bacterium]
MDNLKNFNEGFKNFSVKDDFPDIGADNSLNIPQGKSVSIEEFMATPGPERDQFVVVIIERLSPEDRETMASFYRFAPEEALRRWYAAGDLIAAEALAHHLFYSESQADKAEAQRIAKEIFPKRPSAKSAYVQLAPESEEKIGDKKYDWNEVIQIGESAIDYEMERGIEEKEGSDLADLGMICVLLESAYHGETQALLKYEKYGRSCQAAAEAAEKIDKINDASSPGVVYSMVELLFSLYCLGVSLWFLPSGSEFLGSWFGLVPLIVVVLFVWAAAGSLVGGVISGAVLYGVAWALDNFWVSAPVNASMLPVALIGVFFLWSTVCDIHTSIKWKKGQPARDRKITEQKQIAQKELVFRKSYCQRRLDLCRKLDEDELLGEAKDGWKELEELYQNELTTVWKAAGRLSVNI